MNSSSRKVEGEASLALGTAVTKAEQDEREGIVFEEETSHFT